ncbi:MAG: serine protein kinase PrkA [Syntrophobacteraceae bacterium]
MEPERENGRSAVEKLCARIEERGRRTPIGFAEFAALAAEHPERIFRNIFQMFYDMIYSYIDVGADEYPDDPESVNYVPYDSSRLFEQGTDRPFFGDRLFINRLLGHISSFRRGITQNRIYIFEGPHGSGKSTFLNNLLLKFEKYAATEQGVSFETVWRLDRKLLGNGADHAANFLVERLSSMLDRSAGGEEQSSAAPGMKRYLEIACPSHDSPLLLVPKELRSDFFEELIPNSDFRHKLFSHKQYEWVFKDSPCTICQSLYHTLLDILDSPAQVFEMVYARRSLFNRRLGAGISVFNPGDRIDRTHTISDEHIQNNLNTLFADSNRVRHIYSPYANTNNGIYAIMDIKGHNKERFGSLHGIISEGVHKVDCIEENVNSLFLAVMNPEDRENISDTQSFADRITYVKVPYVLDYSTEVKIYRNIFGDQIRKSFLPMVLENFAKLVISSRLSPQSAGMTEWIPDSRQYRNYCDRNLLLLKMDIYAGKIPGWLSEEDRKNFTAKRRRKILSESESEGDRGFTGRDSIRMFNEFFQAYRKKNKPITMAMLNLYFQKYCCSNGPVPEDVLASLGGLYDYTVLQEVKESLYYYNEENISRQIQNYLFAVNFEIGQTQKCHYTNDELNITEELFEPIERMILGRRSDTEKRKAFRKETQSIYASKTLAREILIEGKKLSETRLYLSLHERYVSNLKENVLDPFLKNDNFRGAVKDYGTEGFKTYDKRIREDVTLLMRNLNGRYGYSENSAREVCLYVIDNGLAKKFAEQ